jgi:hypothetical protein
MPSWCLVGEALRAQLVQGPLRLLHPVDPHPGENPVRLRELDVAVVDNLEMITPGIAKIVVADHLGTGLPCGRERSRSVVDDEPDVALGVGRLRTPFGQREELIAHVHERHSAAAAAQLDLEDAAEEVDCFVQVADLDRDVVDPEKPRHRTSVASAVRGPPRLGVRQITG